MRTRIEGLNAYSKRQRTVEPGRSTADVKLHRAINFKTRSSQIEHIMRVPDISKPLSVFIQQKNLRSQAASLGREIALLDPENVKKFAEKIEQHNPDRNPKFGALLTEVKAAMLLIAEAVESGQVNEGVRLLEKLGEVMQSMEPEAGANVN